MKASVAKNDTKIASGFVILDHKVQERHRAKSYQYSFSLYAAYELKVSEVADRVTRDKFGQ